MLGDKEVCDKVVCERWCVTKLCVWQRGGGEGGGQGGGAGYRIKNKNPTQRCGEKGVCLGHAAALQVSLHMRQFMSDCVLCI